MTKVKICGITILDDALMAAEIGADMLGFNFYQPSPRYITPDDAQSICAGLREKLGDICPVLVGVFVNEPASRIFTIVKQVGLDFSQLSGDESASMLRELQNVAFKAIRPENEETALEDAKSYSPHFPTDERAPSLLLDAYHPKLYGGTGEQASTEIALAVKAVAPHLMLAGGLTPENVVKRIQDIRPWGVDVASGVELDNTKTGEKDPEKVREFIDRVRNFDESNEEMLDYYDANMTYLGAKGRESVHRDGDWHCVFHCWVIYRDNAGKDYMILQKRGPDKKTFPNKLDVSAAGHYEAGETVKDGVRELQEELGLNVQFEDLIPVGRRIQCAKYGDLLDYEVADVFFLICDQPLQNYDYQRDEISGLVKINIDDVLGLFRGKTQAVKAEAIGLGEDRVLLHLSDFIPTSDNYYHKAMLLAKRCLNGEEHLLI